MPDQLARDFATRQLASNHNSLIHAAERLAKDARYYADALARDDSSPRSGEASAIAQAAQQVAAEAARLQGLHDGIAYLDAARRTNPEE